jgi:hypothetical protein
MSEPLDPTRLGPDASLNRVWIMDLPEMALDPDIRGHRAYELLSPEALGALVRAHAGALGLTAADLGDASALPLVLDRCLGSGDPGVRAAADAVARQFGRRLGALVLTLKRGDAANRAARPEWDDSYWGHWAGLRQIWLGGGLLSGRLGPPALAAARAVLAGAGLTGCTLTLADQPAILPLLGAARAVPPGYTTAAVVDFGGTAIKRGVAHFAAGALSELRLLSSVPTDFMALEPLPLAEQLAVLGARMAAALAETWRAAAAAGPPAPVLTASIAAYIEDNQPMHYQRGLYSEMRALSPNLGAWLAERVSAAVGQPVTVHLIHDGTAAARVYAGQPQSAVILLGTALGVGFPPAEDV